MFTDDPDFEVPLTTPEVAGTQGGKTAKRKPEMKTAVPCDVCGITLNGKRRLYIHKLFHHRLEKCDHCPLQFTRYNMSDHFKAAHPDKIPTCGVCGYQHMSRRSVDKHQRSVHMKEKNLKCDRCELTFFDKLHLGQHQKVHSDERPFECDFCPKRFKHSATLRHHRHIHTGEKTKVCPVCAEAFVQKASLNYHMGKYHPGTKF